MYRYTITKDGHTYYQNGASDAAAFLDTTVPVVEYRTRKGTAEINGCRVERTLIQKAEKPEKKKDKLYEYVRTHILMFGNTALDFRHGEEEVKRIIGKLAGEGIYVRYRLVEKATRDDLTMKVIQYDKFYVLEAI